MGMARVRKNEKMGGHGGGGVWGLICQQIPEASGDTMCSLRDDLSRQLPIPCFKTPWCVARGLRGCCRAVDRLSPRAGWVGPDCCLQLGHVSGLPRGRTWGFLQAKQGPTWSTRDAAAPPGLWLSRRGFLGTGEGLGGGPVPAFLYVRHSCPRWLTNYCGGIQPF